MMTRPLRSALVCKGDRAAARLDHFADRTEFRYLAPYRDAPSTPVATTLPLTDTPVVTHAGAVPHSSPGCSARPRAA